MPGNSGAHLHQHFAVPAAPRQTCLCVGKSRRRGEAIQSWNNNKKVVVIGSGGLSHQLDGERAGFINREFDLQFMDSPLTNPEWATQFTIHELVEKTGTQGVELLMWLAMRGALTTGPGCGVRKIHGNYHIPISNTATGLLALEKVGGLAVQCQL